MKNAMLCVIGLLLLAGGPAAGQDADILQKLDGNLRRLTDRADAATVRILLPVVSGWTALPDPRKRQSSDGIELVYEVLGSNSSVTARATVAGVLVGTPPVLVTSADAVGRLKAVSFELADGVNGTAQLKGLDRDLGVAVFTLPAEVAAGRVGLTVKSIPRVGRGHLVIVPGPGDLDVYRPLGLAITRGHAPLGGWFVVDGLSDELLPGQPAIAADGRLLGIAARSVGTTSGYRLRPIVLTKEFLWETEVLKVTPRLERDALDVATYTYWLPTGQQGDELPRGAFIQGSSIARVLDDLKEHGKVRHSYLGVVLGQMRGRGEDRGVEVQAVLEASPAKAAGMKAGMVIRSVAGVLVEDPALVTRALVLHRPGDALKIQVTTIDEVLTVVLGDRDTETKTLLTPSEFGITGMDLGAELRSFLGLSENTRGVVISEVLPQSAAGRAGLVRGQVIVEGAGEAIADLEELRAAVAGAKGELKLVVLAGETRKAVTLKIQATRHPRKAR